jgi:hypothetical protein
VSPAPQVVEAQPLPTVEPPSPAKPVVAVPSRVLSEQEWEAIQAQVGLFLDRALTHLAQRLKPAKRVDQLADWLLALRYFPPSKPQRSPKPATALAAKPAPAHKTMAQETAAPISWLNQETPVALLLVALQEPSTTGGAQKSDKKPLAQLKVEDFRKAVDKALAADKPSKEVTALKSLVELDTKTLTFADTTLTWKVKALKPPTDEEKADANKQLKAFLETVVGQSLLEQAEFRKLKIVTSIEEPAAKPKPKLADLTQTQLQDRVQSYLTDTEGKNDLLMTMIGLVNVDPKSLTYADGELKWTCKVKGESDLNAEQKDQVRKGMKDLLVSALMQHKGGLLGTEERANLDKAIVIDIQSPPPPKPKPEPKPEPEKPAEPTIIVECPPPDDCGCYHSCRRHGFFRCRR